MKLTVELIDGTKWLYEGTYEELVQLSEKLVCRYGDYIKSQHDPSFAGPTRPGPTLAELTGEAPTTVITAPATATAARPRWTEATVRRLVSRLYGEQLKLVKFLASCDGGKTSYAAICKHMGYQGQHLSGILSPITRNAQTATRDKSARLIDWRVTETGGSEYYLDPEALPFLKSIIAHN